MDALRPFHVQHRLGASRGANSTTCVVNVAVGKQYEGLQDQLAHNKRMLCETCGYRCFLHSKALSGRPAAWDKILALQRAFSRGCELCMWMDADVVVRRPLALQPLVTADIIAMHDFNGLNTGVMLLRRSSSVDELLARSWNATQFLNAMWWEQRAIRYVLDLSPHLRGNASLLTKLVAYPFHVDAEAPFFHAAGCEPKPHWRLACSVCQVPAEPHSPRAHRRFQLERLPQDPLPTTPERLAHDGCEGGAGLRSARQQREVPYSQLRPRAKVRDPKRGDVVPRARWVRRAPT